MNDLFATYFIFLAIGIIGFVLFWGAVAYLVIRFLRSGSGLSKAQEYDLLAKGMQAYSGRGGSSEDLMDSQAGSVAASEGIDLNDNR